MILNAMLVGNLGRDPELKYGKKSSKAFCKFSMAVKQGYGENEETLWIQVTTFEKMAEACNQYLSKGSLVAVVPQAITVEAFMGKDGEPKGQLVMTARDVKFLSTDGKKSAPATSEDDEDDDPF